MRNVLVFGASGFVGSNLIQSNNDDVNFIPVGRKAKEGWVNANLTDENFVEYLPKNVDVVVYLAQSKEYRNFPGGAEDMMSVNAMAILKLANWSVANGVKKIIYASTANVYSSKDSCMSVGDETDPGSFYGFSKLSGENVLKQFSSLISVDILRFFTIYGPDQKGMLIPNMIEKVRNQEKITLTNKEGLFLSPIHVNDVVSLINVLSTESVDKIKYEILNVSGTERLSLLDIVKSIGAILNKDLNIDYSPGQEVYLCNADVNTLTDKLGKAYNVCSFSKGIEITINNEV